MNGQSKDASYLEKPLNYQMILLKNSLTVIPTVEPIKLWNRKNTIPQFSDSHCIKLEN